MIETNITKRWEEGTPHNEKDARTKICPYMSFDGYTNCIASDCACWVPYGNQKNPMAEAPAKGEGHCGLIK